MSDVLRFPVVRTTKRCGACRQTKLLAEFGRHRSGLDGVSDTCRECFNARMAPYMRRRGRRRRALWVERLGGRCVVCGSDANLQFHHRDPAEKAYDVSSLFDSGAWVLIRAEVVKCELRCKGCHVEHHRQHRKRRARVENEQKD
jgi:hypothetical protein